MSYKLHEFKSGDTLTAAAINEMDVGIYDATVNLTKGEPNGSIQQEGYDTIDKNGNPAKTLGAIASGKGAIAFGGQRFDKVGEAIADEPQTEAKGEQSFAAGGGVMVDGAWSAGFGKDTKTYQKAGFVSGGGCTAGCTEEEYVTYAGVIKASTNKTAYEASYSFAQAEGDNSKARGYAAHAEGRKTDALGFCAHAEGNETAAIGQFSHTEGIGTKTGRYNQDGTIATSGYACHAEGINTEALGEGSHSEGYETVALRKYSHAGGYQSNARSEGAFVHGKGLITAEDNTYAAAFGKFNEGTKLFEVGMGSSNVARKSVLAVNNNGDLLIYRPGVKNSDGTWSRKPRRYSLVKLLGAVGAFDIVDGWGEGQYTEYDF